MADSGSRKAIGASNSKAARTRVRKAAIGGKAGIPFKSGFRTAGAQKGLATRGKNARAAAKAAAAKASKKGKKK